MFSTYIKGISVIHFLVFFIKYKVIGTKWGKRSQLVVLCGGLSYCVGGVPIVLLTKTRTTITNLNTTNTTSGHL